MAFLTISSTSALLLQESANRPSVYLVVSHNSRLVKLLKKGSVRSIAYASSLMIMQAAFSSVNLGLNSKPSFEKNSIDAFRSRTGRLTNSFRELRAMFSPRSWGGREGQCEAAHRATRGPPRAGQRRRPERGRG